MGSSGNNPGDNGPEVQRFCWKFRSGDRLIQTENNYHRDVFNGDLGVIEKINRIEQVIAFSMLARRRICRTVAADLLIAFAAITPFCQLRHWQLSML